MRMVKGHIAFGYIHGLVAILGLRRGGMNNKKGRNENACLLRRRGTK
jgi:hypothetical protein